MSVIDDKAAHAANSIVGPRTAENAVAWEYEFAKYKGKYESQKLRQAAKQQNFVVYVRTGGALARPGSQAAADAALAYASRKAEEMKKTNGYWPYEAPKTDQFRSWLVEADTKAWEHYRRELSDADIADNFKRDSFRSEYRSYVERQLANRIAAVYMTTLSTVLRGLRVEVYRTQAIVDGDVHYNRVYASIIGSTNAKIDCGEGVVKKIDGLTAQQCFERYCAWQRGERIDGVSGRTREGGNAPLTRRQMQVAQALWSNDVRVKVRASKEEAARREKARISCDDDRWEID